MYPLHVLYRKATTITYILPLSLRTHLRLHHYYSWRRLILFLSVSHIEHVFEQCTVEDLDNQLSGFSSAYFFTIRYNNYGVNWSHLRTLLRISFATRLGRTSTLCLRGPRLLVILSTATRCGKMTRLYCNNFVKTSSISINFWQAATLVNMRQNGNRTHLVTACEYIL